MRNDLANLTPARFSNGPRDAALAAAGRGGARPVGSLAQGCPLTKCRLVRVWLECGVEKSPECSSRAESPPGDLDFKFAPTKDDLTIHWEIENPHNVTSASLRIFAAGSSAVIWRLDLTTSDCATPRAANAFSGALAAPDVANGFPKGVLNIAKAPYLLLMTIEGPYEDGFGEAWTYLDVHAHTVSLAWGADGLLPANRADVGLTWREDPNHNHDAPTAAAALKTRTLAAEVALLRALRNDAAPGAKDHALHLDSSVFRQKGDAITTDHPSYKEAWGDGPRLPLVAKVTVKRANGDEADVEDAVGPLSFLWEWGDPRVEAVDPWQAWTDASTAPKSKTFLKTLFAINKNRYSPPTYNCPDTYGGKHRPGALYFLPAEGEPNAVAVEARRPAAARSEPGAANGARATTAALFQPSRLAGDQYVVSVYALRNEAYVVEPADWSRTPKAFRDAAGVAGVALASSRTLEVQRRVKVFARAVAGAAAWTQSDVKDLFRVQAGVELDVDSAPLDENAYLANDDAIIQATYDEGRQVKPYSLLHFRHLLKRTATGCGVAFESRTDYENAVRPLYRNGPMVKVQGVALGAGAPLAAGAWRGVVAKAVFGDPNVYILSLGGAVPDAGTEVSQLGTPLKFTMPGGAQALNATDAEAIFDNFVKMTDEALESDQKYGQLTGGMGPFRFFLLDRVRTWANAHLGVSVGAALAQFKWVRSTDDFPSGSCVQDVSTRQRGVVLFSTPPDVDLRGKGKDPTVYKPVASLIAHELAHALFLEHTNNTTGALRNAPNAAEDPNYHVSDEACIMNYDPDSAHFCGVCAIRLRGWRESGTTRALTAPTATLALPHGVTAIVAYKGALRGEPVPLRARTNIVCGGNGTLTCTSDAVEVFEDEACQRRVDLTGGLAVDPVELARGKTLYVRALKAGNALNNVTFTLDAPGATRQTETVTTLEARIEICRTRARKGDAPPVMPEREKLSPGRFIAKQDGAGQQGRAKVIVHRPKPDAYTGDVTVAPSANLRLFAKEKFSAREQPLATWKSPAARIPAEGVALWVEGAQTSVARGGATVAVRVDGSDLDADRVAFTVIELAIEAEIPVTPPTQARNVRVGVNDVPNAGARGAAPAQRATFDADAGAPLVLPYAAPTRTNRGATEPSAAPVTLKLVIPDGPAPPFSWTIIRAKDDASGIKKLFPQEVPVLSYRRESAQRALLERDAVGTFHVVAFLDDNGTMRFDPKVDRAPFAVFNVVLVGAVAHTNTSRAAATGFNLMQDADSVAIQDFSQTSVTLEADVQLVGGGKKGRRGLDRASVFWAQNVLQTSYPARYSHTRNGGGNIDLPMVFAANVHDATERVAPDQHAEPMFKVGDPAVVPLAPRILDSGNAPLADGTLPGTRLGLGRQGGMLLDATLGKRGLISATDAPNRSVPKQHPNAQYTGSALHTFGWMIEFEAFLCLCTGRTAMDTSAPNVPERRLYSVFATTRWQVDGTWDLTQPNWDQTKPTVQVTAAPVLSPPVDAVDTALEVGAPTMLATAAFDATADPLNVGW